MSQRDHSFTTNPKADDNLMAIFDGTDWRCIGVSTERVFPEPVLDARATAKVVYSVLERRGELTVMELVDETGQSRRAVETALQDLAERDTVISKPDPTEPRRDVWTLTDC